MKNLTAYFIQLKFAITLPISVFIVIIGIVRGAVADAALKPVAYTVTNNREETIFNTISSKIAQNSSDEEQAPAPESLQKAVLQEINRARTDPGDYADWLEEMKQYYDGISLKLPGEKPIRINRGSQAFESAIEFLKEQEALPALSLSKGLTMAATQQIQKGDEGSTLDERVDRYGTADGDLAQNITDGRNTAQGVVMQLILDENFRKNIFNQDFKTTGVNCGANSNSENICVVNYAEEYTEQVANSEENTDNLSATNSKPLSTQRIEEGILEEGDKIIPNDSSLYDTYPLQGRAGDSFTLRAESKDFDTFLAVMDAEGNVIQQNDDISDNDSNSTLRVTLPSDGMYSIIVNSYDEKGRGRYTLKVLGNR